MKSKDKDVGVNDVGVNEEELTDQAEQIEAFQHAVKIFKNAGLYVTSSFTLQNEGTLRISITATNDHPNKNIAFAPANNGIPAPMGPAGRFT